MCSPRINFILSFLGAVIGLAAILISFNYAYKLNFKQPKQEINHNNYAEKQTRE